MALSFAGEMESIEEYLAFLQPLVLAMLETKAVVERSNKERRRPTAIGGKVTGERGEVTTK